MRDRLRKIFSFPAPKSAAMVQQTAKQRGVVLGGNNSGFLNTGEVHGDVVIVEGVRTQCNLHIPFDVDLRGASPAKLLRWSSRLPREMVGREQEMTALKLWAESDAFLSCAVMEGGAGVGKTRLAFELADRLRQQGWQAGQLKDPAQPVAFEASEQGVLLILDYPEEQPIAIEKFFDGLARAEVSSVKAELPKLRVLLLCRDHARLQPLHAFLARHAPKELVPLRLQALTEQAPWELFEQARRAFSSYPTEPFKPSAAAHPLSRESFDAWLAQDAAHASALIVQALALSQNDAPGLAKPRDELVEYLLDREQAHFFKRCQALDWPNELQQGAWMLQIAAAIPGVIEFIELDVLHADLPPEDLGGRILPTQIQWRSLWGSKSTGLRGIEPDLFAAHALHNPRFMPDVETLAPSLARALLQLEGGDFAAHAQRLQDRLNRLARLNWDRPAAQSGKIDPWLEAAKDLAQSNAQSPAWERALNKATLPNALRLLAVALLQSKPTVLRALPDDSLSPDQKSQRARDLNNLSNHLAEAGERAQGLEAIRRAVEIYEKLALDNFAAYAPDLAMSLNNLSNHLAEAGERAQGLKAIRRAVEIREKLALDNFAAYAPGLAGSLNNLSNHLAEAGERAQGLTAAERACELIAPFALPNTTYADWQAAMLRQRDALRATQADRASE